MKVLDSKNGGGNVAAREYWFARMPEGERPSKDAEPAVREKQCKDFPPPPQRKRRKDRRIRSRERRKFANDNKVKHGRYRRTHQH